MNPLNWLFAFADWIGENLEIDWSFDDDDREAKR